MTKSPPKGMYIVAVIFFFAGLMFMAQVLIFAFELFGASPALNLGTIKWRLAVYLAALGLILYGVFLLMRLHPAGRWLMLGMTLFLTAALLITPTAASVLYSQPRLYVNRILLLLPMVLSCVYLFWPRLRASKLS